jgi:hypothetical protein
MGLDSTVGCLIHLRDTAANGIWHGTDILVVYRSRALVDFSVEMGAVAVRYILTIDRSSSVVVERGRQSWPYLHT